MSKNNRLILKIVLSGCLIAIGWVLPLATGQIKEIGNMLCPMHIPTYIGGFLLGPIYGLIIGFIIPLTRSLIFGMPPLFPNSLCMSIELGSYGFFSGLIFRILIKNILKHNNDEDANIGKKRLVFYTLISLIIAMVLGRVIWGAARLLCAMLPNNSFTIKAFISGALLTAWPGMIIQLILIPCIVIVMEKNIIKNIKY